MPTTQLLEGFLSKQGQIPSYEVPKNYAPDHETLKHMFYDFYFLNGYIFDPKNGLASYPDTAHNNSQINRSIADDEDDEEALKEAVQKNFHWIRGFMEATIKFALAMECFHFVERTEEEMSRNAIVFKRAIMEAKGTSDHDEQDRILMANNLPGEVGIYNFSQGQQSNTYSTYGERFATFIKAQKATHLSDSEIADVLMEGFKSSSWAARKGAKHGGLWYQIAKNWKAIIDAPSDAEATTYIGTIINLQHGNGTILNKLKTFWSPNDGYHWIDEILDFKSRTKSIWDYLGDNRGEPRISYPLRVLVTRLGNVFGVE